MRRLSVVFALLAASPGLRAERAETPFLVYREPDPVTRDRIADFITEKQLGGQVPDVRRRVREELAGIGPWCVPVLSTALRKETVRVRLNAVLALAMIRDPRGLPALREAAQKDGDLFVRRAATLAIALFEHEEDLDTLRKLVATPRAEWRTIAPALARLRAKDAAGMLKAASADDEHDRAAIVLASAIVLPEPPAVELLEDRAKLVQQAAAAGLAVRPLAPQHAGAILAALDRSRMDKDARVLAIRALGAIEPRPAEAQKGLLEIACRDGDGDERIAALLELRGSADEFGPLWKAYRKLAQRDQPVVAALMLALARTREDQAVEALLRLVRPNGSDFHSFYAGAALLFAFGPEKLKDEYRVRIVEVEKLAPLAQGFSSASAEVRKKALADLRVIEDPENLKLYLPREERNWLEVNRVLTKIFELGQVLTQFDSQRLGRTPESPLGGGSGGADPRKAASGSDEQQDLFDLLIPPKVPEPPGGPPYPERKPYFGPEDLGAPPGGTTRG